MLKDSYLRSIYSYPEQFKQAWKEVKKLPITPEFAEVGDAIVSGMGASIFGGLVMKSVFANDKLHVPVNLVSGYDLPEYADERTLLVTTSYSGNTEETLSIFDQGWDKGCPIVSVTTGGKLEAKALKHQLPIYTFKPKSNPSSAPRTGVGYTIGATLAVFSKLNLLDFTDNDANQAYEYMKNFVNAMQKDDRMVSQIAQKTVSRVPIFVSAEHLASGAHIWRNFMNETSKHVGFTYEIPDMNHHFLDGLMHPSQNKDNFIFIYLMSGHYSPQIKKRFEVTREITKKAGMLDVSITLGGKGRLQEVLELIIIGSLISYDIAKYHNANPSSNEMVDYLKSKL